MRELEPDFAALGINVRCITIGSQAKAEEYCARHNPGTACIGDATMHTYKAMGLDDFDLSTLKTNVALVRRREENEAAGFVQDWDATRIEDAAQNPGAAFIDASGVLRFVHRGTHPGDLPPLAALLETVRSLA
ncbi:MAG: hypothetical protein NVS2B17_18460 [Candidatus Velthaea sp.]